MTNLKLIIGVALSLALFQNCSGDGFQSITAGSQAYLSSNAITNFQNQISVNEDSVLKGNVRFYNDPEQKLRYKIVSQPKLGKITSFNELTAEFSYTPNENTNGTDSFDVVVELTGTFAAQSKTIQLEIVSVNDLPLAANSNVNTNEDVPVNGELKGVDVDDKIINFTIMSPPQKGTVKLNDTAAGTFTYTPNLNASGTDSFTFKVSDSVGSSNVATVSVNLNNVNDAPAAQALSSSTAEDVNKNIQLTATDADGDAVTYKITTQPLHGQVMLNGNTGLATYIPAANYNGPDSFQYAASDGSTQSEPKAVTLSVSPVNDAPIATNQIVKTLRNRTVDFELTATDVENNSLTVFNPTAITSGILYYMGGKKYSYRPNVGFVGEASFSYMASDGQLSSNFATVRILVEDLGSTFTYEPDYDVNSNQTVTTTLFVPEAPAGRAPVLVIDTLAQISCNVADVNCYAGYSLKLVAPDGTAVYNWVTVQGLGGVASANLTITEGEDRFGLDIFATQNAVKLVNTPAGNWTLTLSADGRTRFSIRSWKVILKPVP